MYSFRTLISAIRTLSESISVSWEHVSMGNVSIRAIRNYLKFSKIWHVLTLTFLMSFYLMAPILDELCGHQNNWVPPGHRIDHPWKFGVNRSRRSWVIVWKPILGGHFVLWRPSWLSYGDQHNRVPPGHPMDHPWKFGVIQCRRSWVSVWKPTWVEEKKKGKKWREISRQDHSDEMP